MSSVAKFPTAESASPATKGLGLLRSSLMELVTSVSTSSVSVRSSDRPRYPMRFS